MPGSGAGGETLPRPRCACCLTPHRRGPLFLLQAMGGNYFLYIILGITALVVLSWLTGAI